MVLFHLLSGSNTPNPHPGWPSCRAPTTASSPATARTRTARSGPVPTWRLTIAGVSLYSALFCSFRTFAFLFMACLAHLLSLQGLFIRRIFSLFFSSCRYSFVCGGFLSRCVSRVEGSFWWVFPWFTWNRAWRCVTVCVLGSGRLQLDWSIGRGFGEGKVLSVVLCFFSRKLLVSR